MCMSNKTTMEEGELPSSSAISVGITKVGQIFVAEILVYILVADI